MPPPPGRRRRRCRRRKKKTDEKTKKPQPQPRPLHPTKKTKKQQQQKHTPGPHLRRQAQGSHPLRWAKLRPRRGGPHGARGLFRLGRGAQGAGARDLLRDAALGPRARGQGRGRSWRRRVRPHGNQHHSRLRAVRRRQRQRRRRRVQKQAAGLDVARRRGRLPARGLLGRRPLRPGRVRRRRVPLAEALRPAVPPGGDAL